MKSATRNLTLPATAAIVTIIASVLALRTDRQACPTAKEFTDSLTSNRSRLAAVDGVLNGYDLREGALPIGPDTAPGSNAANRLERRIVALRMQGVTAKQIDRWLREDVHLTPGAGAASHMIDDQEVQLIHRLETDSSYISGMRKQLLVTNDLWHDMSLVPSLTARWIERCSAYRSEVSLLLAGWVTAMLALVAWGWWRRRSA